MVNFIAIILKYNIDKRAAPCSRLYNAMSHDIIGKHFVNRRVDRAKIAYT